MDNATLTVLAALIQTHHNKAWLLEVLRSDAHHLLMCENPEHQHDDEAQAALAEVIEITEDLMRQETEAVLEMLEPPEPPKKKGKK